MRISSCFCLTMSIAIATPLVLNFNLAVLQWRGQGTNLAGVVAGPQISRIPVRVCRQGDQRKACATPAARAKYGLRDPPDPTLQTVSTVTTNGRQCAPHPWRYKPDHGPKSPVASENHCFSAAAHDRPIGLLLSLHRLAGTAPVHQCTPVTHDLIVAATSTLGPTHTSPQRRPAMRPCNGLVVVATQANLDSLTRPTSLRPQNQIAQNF